MIEGDRSSDNNFDNILNIGSGDNNHTQNDSEQIHRLNSVPVIDIDNQEEVKDEKTNETAENRERANTENYVQQFQDLSIQDPDSKNFYF